MSVAGEAIFNRALRRTVVQIGVVGVGCVLFGLFVMALHALKLDPSAVSMGTGMVVALYAFGCMTVGVGFAAVFVAIFKIGGRNRELRRRLQNGAVSLVKVETFAVTRRGYEPGIPSGGQFQGAVRVHFGDREHFELLCRGSDVAVLSAWIRAQRDPR